MGNWIYILAIFLVFFSCNKQEVQEEEETITLQGRILKDCTLDPYRNTYIRFLVFTPVNPPFNSVKNHIFFTDSAGNFNYTFIKKVEPYRSVLQIDDIGIYPYKNYNMGAIITRPVANIVVKLKINNPYSVGDTLYFPKYGTNKWDTIPCPLSDTIFQPVYNFSRSGQVNVKSKNTVRIIGNYSVWGGSSYQELINERISASIPGCTGNLDTVEIEIN